MRAMQCWSGIGTVEAWQAACEAAPKRYESGRFLFECLGIQRVLDPKLMATLWQLRKGLIAEYGAESPGMTMAIDLAVMAYANALRVQGWIGDLGLSIEPSVAPASPGAATASARCVAYSGHWPGWTGQWRAAAGESPEGGWPFIPACRDTLKSVCLVTLTCLGIPAIAVRSSVVGEDDRRVNLAQGVWAFVTFGAVASA